MTRDERGQRGLFSGLVLKGIIVAIYVTFVWLLLGPFTAWLTLRKSADEAGLSAAAGYDSHNSFYHYLLGRYYHLTVNNPDMDKAIGQYRESIKLSPLDAEAWVGLSNACQMSGKMNEAEYALERAVGLEPTDPDLMWEAATFWLLNNRTDNAVGVLRRYILLQPDKQRDVYDLCRKLQLDNGYILANLVPPEYVYRSGYLSYLISVGEARELSNVWRIIDKKKVGRKLFVDYVNFLISNRLYEEAAMVWDEMMLKQEGPAAADDEGSLLWNPGFEQDIMDGGFDWLIGEAEGADVFVDDSVHMTGARSLGVSFDGKQNPDITIASQVVRVSPGASYALKGYIKTESLTTDSGIFFSVEGHKCGAMNERSEMVTGTNFWKEVTVNFKAPEDCSAVIFKIRRERSVKFDNRISGSAWIDGITLTQTMELPKAASKER